MPGSNNDRSLSVALDAALKGNLGDDAISSLGTIPLLDICSGLKDALCCEAEVGGAMRVIAAAVQRREMNDTELSVVLKFLCGKLSAASARDAAVLAIGDIISDLGSRTSCCTGLGMQLVDEFLGAVDCQSLPAALRKAIFGVSHFLFDDPALCQSYNSQQLRLLLTAVDGESDPELVLQVFEFCTDVCNAASASRAATDVLPDFFDSISCYFPVVFSQPPGCPVTKEVLKQRLHRCMSHSSFSEVCLPFLLSKLRSPSLSVKSDVIQLLGMCINTYSVDQIQEHARSLVMHLRNEVVLQSQESELAQTGSPILQSSLNLLQDICRKLIPGSVSTSLLTVFDPVVEGVNVSLSSARSTYCAYATMVFNIMSVADESCLAFFVYLFPLLCTHLGGNNPSVLVLLSATVNAFVDGCVRSGTLDQAAAPHVSRASMLLVEHVCQLSTQLLSERESEPLKRLCIIEFVASSIKLIHLMGWNLAGGHSWSELLMGLFRAATHENDPSLVRRTQNSVISAFSSLDWDVCEPALSRCFHVDGILPSSGLQFLVNLSSRGIDAACFVILDGLLTSDSSCWILEAPTALRAASLQQILDCIEEGSLSDLQVGNIAEKLLAQRSVEYFTALCTLYSKACRSFCVQQHLEVNTIESYTSTAALLVAREDMVIRSEMCTDLLTASAIALSSGAYDAQISANLVVGLVRNHPSLQVNSDGHEMHNAYFLVATFWGDLLRGPRSEQFLSQELREKLVSNLKSEEKSIFIEAVGFAPYAAMHRPVRGSLWSAFLTTALTDGSLLRQPVFWTSLLRAQESETVEFLSRADSITLLLSVVHQGCKEEVEAANLRALLLQMYRRGIPCDLIHDATFKHAGLWRCLLCELSDNGEGKGEDLPTRCSVLEFMTESGTRAAAILQDSSLRTAERSALLMARPQVVSWAQTALSDRKRKVRVAAARCIHQWMRLPSE